jgi:DNA topoisomerase I
VIGRLVGEHPDGGPVTVRDGRYGAYVNWGKVNATISKGTAPDSITLSDALELIAEREGKPVARPRSKPAKKAPARGKTSPAKTAAPESAGARAQPAGAKKATAKKTPAAKPKSAASGKRA